MSRYYEAKSQHISFMSSEYRHVRSKIMVRKTNIKLKCELTKYIFKTVLDWDICCCNKIISRFYFNYTWSVLKFTPNFPIHVYILKYLSKKASNRLRKAEILPIYTL